MIWTASRSLIPRQSLIHPGMDVDAVAGSHIDEVLQACAVPRYLVRVVCLDRGGQAQRYPCPQRGVLHREPAGSEGPVHSPGSASPPRDRAGAARCPSTVHDDRVQVTREQVLRAPD